MKFKSFMSSNRHIAMTITGSEYYDIRFYLNEEYTKKIDDFLRFKPDNERFLLCNQELFNSIGTPYMLASAVTFVDRIPYKNIDFE